VTIPVAQFQLTNPGNNPATISTISLTGSGTGNFTAGINSANLFLDVNGNGVQDGGDILLGMGNYSGATVTINLNISIPAGATATFLVVYQFSNSAPLGAYMTQLSGASGNNAGGALQFTGMPLNAATINIASATNTPIVTSTSTLTPTATWTSTSTVTTTATLTMTNTKTPSPSPTEVSNGGVVIEPPFPNPAQGPVTFQIHGNGTLDVHWSVFTSGFRKINGGAATLNGSGSIEWNLRDKMGVLVADGIYYVRIDVSSGVHLSKVWKVLVLR
jgi:hypothetical protein